jgi:5-methyltetrahydrofolate--homocysteine methyltransferase
VTLLSWGRSAGEQLNEEDLRKVKYDGIRPAPGKRKSLREFLFESLSMHPECSVREFVFAHPQSEYFGEGQSR